MASLCACSRFIWRRSFGPLLDRPLAASMASCAGMAIAETPSMTLHVSVVSVLRTRASLGLASESESTASSISMLSSGVPKVAVGASTRGAQKKDMRASAASAGSSLRSVGGAGVLGSALGTSACIMDVIGALERRKMGGRRGPLYLAGKG